MISNSDHVTYFNNPDEVLEKVIGFFNRTILHEFTDKPRTLVKLARQPSIKNCLEGSCLPDKRQIELVETDLNEDGDWEHLDLSPNEEVPKFGGYFTYIKERAIEAYIDYNDEENAVQEVN